jgi:3-deoxy-D-manno-octulosonic-acid transferase
LSLFLYNLSIRLYAVLIRVAALWNPKARQLVEGRKDLLGQIEAKLRSNSAPIVWFHVASLGEFEQARPVMEQFRKDHPAFRIVLTFFSPSGYEVRKNYVGVDYVFYLPEDTRRNARRFLDLVNPSLALFAKYEFWYHYLTELNRRKIPVISFSAIFRPSQLFFKPWGSFFRRILQNLTHIFVQNEESARLLAGIGLKDITLAGDTRFDRVAAVVAGHREIPVAAAFRQGQPLLVIGSAWLADMAIIAPFLNNFNSPLKVIVAPHELHEEWMQQMERELTLKTIRYSKAGEATVGSFDVLIIDNIGMLSSLYAYGDFAWIGGGFGKGIHNTLEAATFGMPVFFGPRHGKFQEALDMIRLGGAFGISTTKELAEIFNRLYHNHDLRRQASLTTRQYVIEHTGATQVIMEMVREMLKG